MRYYVGSLECKIYHVDRMEQIWIQRELGDELYNEIQQDYCKVTLLRSNPVGLPSDIYKRIDVYVDIDDPHRQTLFLLKFPKVMPLPLAK